jgi:thioesterase domain-containing protein
MNTEMPPATPELFNTVLAQTIPRAADMGIEVIELRPGYVKSKTPFEGNGNHIGTMYAGVIFTAAELLGGAIALSTFDMTRFYPVIKGMTINFRRPATSAVYAEASMTDELVAELAEKAAANGKAEFIFETTLTDEAGEVVATTEGTYQLRSHTPPANAN